MRGRGQATIRPHAFALGILAEAPTPGSVKTQLSPPLTLEAAAAVAEAFLLDTLATVEHFPARHRVILAAPERDGVDELQRVAPRSFRVIPQRGDGAAERFFHGLEDLLALNAEAALVIDTNTPFLPMGAIIDAFLWLTAPGAPTAGRIAIGPSEDGDYYALGVTRVHHRLFEGITWPGDGILEQTLARASELGLEVQTMPVRYDVDTLTDLQRITHEKEYEQVLGPAVTQLLARADIAAWCQ
jgi:uncharacterized protein